MTSDIFVLTIKQKELMAFNRLPYYSVILSIGLLMITYAHAQVVRSPLDNQIKNSKTLDDHVKLTIEAGDLFYNTDKPTAAKHYYERAVADGRRLGIHPLYALALQKLANLHDNKPIKRSLYEESMEIYEKIYGANDLNIAGILEAIVLTYDYLNRDTNLVIEMIKRAAKIRQLHKEYDTLPTTLRTLAWLYEIKKDLRNAEKYYKDAYTIEAKHLGFKDIRVILSAENMAHFYLDIGDYRKAERLLLETIKLHQGNALVDYYNLGRAESMLAWVYYKQRKPKKAEHYFLNAFRHIQRGINDDVNHPSYPTLPTLLDLNFFYVEQGQYDEARRYFKQAEQIILDTDGTSMADYANFLENEIISGNSTSHSWSASAQIDGIRHILEKI